MSEEPPKADEELRLDAAERAAEAFRPGEEPTADMAPGEREGRIGRSTAFFSIATAASRTAGLVREIVAAGRFGAFAISPFFWNVVIIAVLVGLAPAFSGNDRIYAYAIGILAGTVVQLLIPAWDLRHTPFRFNWSFDWRNRDVRRVLLLMLPVALSLG